MLSDPSRVSNIKALGDPPPPAIRVNDPLVTYFGDYCDIQIKLQIANQLLFLKLMDARDATDLVPSIMNVGDGITRILGSRDHLLPET